MNKAYIPALIFFSPLLIDVTIGKSKKCVLIVKNLLQLKNKNNNVFQLCSVDFAVHSNT